MKPHEQNQILAQALTAIEREAGLRVTLEKLDPAEGRRNYDAALRIDGTRLLVEVKKWAQHANIGALIDQIKKMPEPGILVADFVNPRMAEKLRAHDIQFLDTAGNAFINTPPTCIYIRGNRPEKTPATRWKREDAYGRAFAPTGLKVLYAFLCDPELVNAPYREIANVADAAVGTVGWVLNDLKADRYIADLGRGRKRRLNDYRRLLDRWTEAYPEKLRPKQLLGVFEAEHADWWKHVDIADFNAYWGGETAAAKLTNFLQPEVATIYLREDGLAKLVVTNRLRKATEATQIKARNTVYVLDAFWNAGDAKAQLVDPVLVYADLIATADPRNREAAQIIFDEHIANRIREN
jgi:hypothetical protein